MFIKFKIQKLFKFQIFLKCVKLIEIKELIFTNLKNNFTKML